MAQPREFYTDISGLQNSLRDWAIDPIAADPTTPVAGQMWFNTTDSALRYYDGVTTITLADAADIVGGLVFKGGYDATADSPILDGDGGIKITVETGDVYVVTADGTFYTETVTTGDLLIARNATNASIADWVVVERNLNQASESEAGIAEIATQAETDAGTDDLRIVTPLKLATYINSLGLATSYLETGNVDLAATGLQSTTITHNLNQRPVHVTVMNEADNELIDVDVAFPTVNTVILTKQGPGIASISVAVTS